MGKTKNNIIKVKRKVADRAPEDVGLQYISTVGLGEKKLLYGPSDVDDDYSRNLGLPGEYPYTRGIYPTMHRGQLWSMRELFGFGSPEETNRRLKFILDSGATALSPCHDIPTHMGLDSDNPLSEGEVGRGGVPIDSLEDMEIVYEGIPIEKIRVDLLESNASSPVLLAMFIVLAQKRGINLEILRGSIQNNYLELYESMPKFAVYPPRAGLKIVTDTFVYCTKHMPFWTTININGHFSSEAGATIVHEMAFCLANAMTYVQSGIEAGLSVDDFAPRIGFYASARTNIFEEVAKYRASRRLWAKIMKERFGAKDQRSLTMKIHCQCSAYTYTAQQPKNNIIRGTLEALAGILGGAQSVAINSMDEALSLPTEEGARIALRTQQILAYESGITETIDPLGGSYYVEALTNQIENKVKDILNEIEKMGDGDIKNGVIKGIENGWFIKHVRNSAYDFSREIASGQRVIVGQNRFTVDEEIPIEIQEIDPSLEEAQKKKLARLRERRDNEKVEDTLNKVRATIRQGGNMIYPIIEAVTSYATLGEICSVMKEELGEYVPSAYL